MRIKYCKTCEKDTKYKFDDLGDTYCTKCNKYHYSYLSGRKKWVLVALVLILLVFFIKLFAPEPQTNPNNFSNETIACLKEQYTYYGESWCKFCNQQKSDWGDVVNEVSYIDCATNRAKCIDLNIEAYPTHIIFNKISGEYTRLTGLENINKLLELTGCE